MIMSHLYTSVAYALNRSRNHLHYTRKEFRDMIKYLKANPQQLASGEDAEDGELTENQQSINLTRSFLQSAAAKAVHHSKIRIEFNATLRHELRLIERALSSEWIDLRRPISHMIKRTPSGVAHSDSCLRAAGGFSISMGFWWYIEWPAEVQQLTLRYIKNDKDSRLISINALEYAAVIITYVAAVHFFRTKGKDPADPYPNVLQFADNTVSESWAMNGCKAPPLPKRATAEWWLTKGCKLSQIGRGLGRLQCALMMNSNVGLSTSHVTTKDNIIADRISRVKRETDIIPSFDALAKDFRVLSYLDRFHPPQELVSAIIATLLRRKSFDVLAHAEKALGKLDKSTF